MTNLYLRRLIFTNESTIGDLYVGEEYECHTLEDTCRYNAKIPGKTAIPEGRYEVVINWSNRFKKEMPLLIHVPMFSGIRIHPGNTAANTDGCILVGRTKSVNFIGESQIAFNDLFPKLKTLLAKEKVFIDINGGKKYKEIEENLT